MTSWDAGFFAATTVEPVTQCCWVRCGYAPTWLLGVGGGGGAAMLLDATRLQVMAQHAVNAYINPPVLGVPGVLRTLHAQVEALARQDVWKGATAQALALAVDEDGAWLGHVGMCRAYLVTAGGVTQLTRDDSLSNAQADAGLVGDAWHARVVTRVLGMDPVGPITVTRHDVRPGRALLLCTELDHLLPADATAQARRVFQGVDTQTDCAVAAAQVWRALRALCHRGMWRVFDREVGVAVVRPRE